MPSTFGPNMSNLQTLIFTGKNYEYWSLTMKDFFRGQYVWDIVQNGYAKPADQNAYNNLSQAEKDILREHRKKDGKLYSIYIKPCMKAYSQEQQQQLLQSRHGHIRDNLSRFG